MSQPKPLDKSLADLTCADFAPGVAQPWTLVTPQFEIPLILESATEQAHALAPTLRKPFSLIFHTQEMRYPPQGTYVLRQDDLGAVEVFVVPLGPLLGQSDVFRYQVCFN